MSSEASSSKHQIVHPPNNAQPAKRRRKDTAAEAFARRQNFSLAPAARSPLPTTQTSAPSHSLSTNAPPRRPNQTTSHPPLRTQNHTKSPSLTRNLVIQRRPVRHTPAVNVQQFAVPHPQPSTPGPVLCEDKDRDEDSNRHSSMSVEDSPEGASYTPEDAVRGALAHRMRGKSTRQTHLFTGMHKTKVIRVASRRHWASRKAKAEAWGGQTLPRLIVPYLDCTRQTQHGLTEHVQEPPCMCHSQRTMSRVDVVDEDGEHCTCALYYTGFRV